MVAYLIIAWLAFEFVVYVYGARVKGLGWSWPIDRVKWLISR